MPYDRGSNVFPKSPLYTLLFQYFRKLRDRLQIPDILYFTQRGSPSTDSAGSPQVNSG